MEQEAQRTEFIAIRRTQPANTAAPASARARFGAVIVCSVSALRDDESWL